VAEGQPRVRRPGGDNPTPLRCHPKRCFRVGSPGCVAPRTRGTSCWLVVPRVDAELRLRVAVERVEVGGMVVVGLPPNRDPERAAYLGSGRPLRSALDPSVGPSARAPFRRRHGSVPTLRRFHVDLTVSLRPEQRPLNHSWNLFRRNLFRIQDLQGHPSVSRQIRHVNGNS
jgi:hypothetical protein